jgi:hypothetical protein
MLLSREPLMLPEAPAVIRLPLKEAAPGILGYRALAKAQTLEELPAGEDDRVVAARRELSQALDGTRQQIAALPNINRRGFNAYTGQHIVEEDKVRVTSAGQISASDYLRHMTFDWASWLQNDASDSELLDHCAWNAGRLIKEQNDPAFWGMAERAKHQSKRGLQRGIQAKAVHPAAEDALPFIDGIEVRLSDYIDLGAKGWEGYTYNKSNTIYVAEGPTSGAVAWNRLRVMRHEIGHAAIGSLYDRLRDEIITEQHAHAFTDNKWLDLRPDAHRQPIGSYVNSRWLGSVLWRPSDVRQLCLAYSAPTEESKEKHMSQVRGTGDNPRQQTARIDAIMAKAIEVGAAHNISYSTAIERATKVLLIFGDSPRLRPELAGRDREGVKQVAREVKQAVLEGTVRRSQPIAA